MAERPVDGNLVAHLEIALGLPANRSATLDTACDAESVMPADLDRRPSLPGDVEAAQQRCEDVIADCTVAIRNHPGSGQLYIERGDAWSCLGRFEEAIADYDRAISLDADNAAAYFRRCLAKSELGLHVEAIEDYDELMRLEPDAMSTCGEC